jgi:hypothetical protein
MRYTCTIAYAERRALEAPHSPAELWGVWRVNTGFFKVEFSPVCSDSLVF